MSEDFYNCVSIEENGEVIRVTIAAAAETIFEIPHSASRYLEIIADICTIVLPVMRLDSDVHKWWNGGSIGPIAAKPSDVLAIEQFKEKYAGKIVGREGDII